MAHETPGTITRPKILYKTSPLKRKPNAPRHNHIVDSFTCDSITDCLLSDSNTVV